MNKNFFLSILTLLLLSSCSCHRRMARLQKRCPQCFEKIMISDTVATPSIRIDTVFVAKSTLDTFCIEHNRVELEVIKQVDTFYATLSLKPDTIYRTLHLPAPHIEPSPDDQEPIPHKVARLMRPAVWLVPFIIVLWIYIRRKKLFH
ncbi:MAG: hypothetical protein J6V54_10695 [Bacteroidales bacterium]|nr:hypothetical protein [Bacteroidales bacterium]